MSAIVGRRRSATRARVRGVALAVTSALVALAPPAFAALQRPARILVDGFEDPKEWIAQPSDGVKLTLSSDQGVHGRSLRLDFAFSGGGYAVVHRNVSLDLPENYRFRFAVRGKCRPNDLEFKLVDSTGDNVWWSNRRRFHFPEQWDSLSTRKRQIEFAWGPKGGGDIHHVAAIEFAVTAGEGGTGTVWLDDLTLEPLPPANTPPPTPVASASSHSKGLAATRATDGDTVSYWASAPGDARPWLALDLGMDREFGGLTIDWVAGRHATDYVVETSDDGRTWRVARTVRGSDGGRDPLYMPEFEARHLRVRALVLADGRDVAIREITIEPIDWSATPARFFESLAKDAPRGQYPRAISGEMTYWTVVGLDGGDAEGLLDIDGRLETGKAMYAIEPFVRVGHRLYTWADSVACGPEMRGGKNRLAEGDLPIPTTSVCVDSGGHDPEGGPPRLIVTAFAVEDGPRMPEGLHAPLRRSPGMIVRYRFPDLPADGLDDSTRITLYLALRPFQVNPPSQFLNTPGGFAPIRTIERDGDVVRVNGDHGLVSLTPPSGWGASTFDGGEIGEHLRAGSLPDARAARDSLGFASGALAYDLEVPGEGERSYEVDVFVPFRDAPAAPETKVDAGDVAEAEAASRAYWKARDGDVKLDLPAAEDVALTIRAQLNWILVNRDSAAIQPGSRAYERSWIRDGALTSSALLRLGKPEVVKAFIEWFANYQYPDGKVPCCVDWRGADPVPEHDSSGELIYAVADYYRYTGDRATVEKLWPHVAAAAAYLDSLRRIERVPATRVPGKVAFYGVLPPSISHEGYSAKPMHSYWDDFFTLRGFKDATFLAGILGRDADRARLAAIRDTFQADLSASIAAAMKEHHIDYVPGAADLGDFDPTSTTIALDPVAAEGVPPAGALQRTFERYWDFFRDRRDGVKPWVNFTPYEMRNIGAFVRLGWRDRADQLLDFFMKYRRPPGWREWAEVVWHDPKTPHFIGDMPHTWVGSDFVRSTLDMFAYARERDSSLVVASGMPWKWVPEGEASGAGAIGPLPTPYGSMIYTIRRVGGPDAVEVRIEAGPRIPPGGIVVRPPSRGGFKSVTVNGRKAKLGEEGSVIVRALPAVVVFGS